MKKLILATEQGMAIIQRDPAGWQLSARGLEGQHVTSVTSRERHLLAGTENGIFVSGDEGSSWAEADRGLTLPHIRWMAHHPDRPGLVFAGTEPAGIFVSNDAGQSWRACSEVAELRDRYQWSLPYSPEAGCVRGFAFHGRRGYAAVEVGGVLISEDQGESWRLAEGSDGSPDLEGPPEPLIYPDLHSIEVHPSSADRVYAPTGGGFYGSNNGGKTWRLLYDCYCRAVWVDPEDPEHIILGPADYVDSNGRIEESRDGGETWTMASGGLRVPWRRGMVERFFQAGDELFAVLANGQLVGTSLAALDWEHLVTDITGVNAIAALD